ncbi:hypothetical protein [Jannaschia sp. W003]|uniref:hypothetical protein n=1 Tax=Jannaschia sp. W003 TaxID=2867012 RepID=UPI0021A67954|nr:hypothetical protein [Jannaschia sp. W003]UWQ22097.1 hypothetical protein K3554_03430 [Jannaschia sp. W003]
MRIASPPLFALAVLCFAAALAAAARAAEPATVPMTIPPAPEADATVVRSEAGRRTMEGLPATLRAVRRRMQQGGAVEPAQLRALADRGDGLAAQRYARLLLADPESSASDRAFYAALAVRTGRSALFRPMLRAMARLDPATEPPERVRRLIATLYPQAWAGNAAALDAVERFNGEGRLFGALSDATRERMLALMRRAGDGRGQLAMAVSLMETRPAAPAPWPGRAEADALIAEAGASDHPGVAAAAAALAAILAEESDP